MAFDAKTGEEVYKKRLGASGPYSASPVTANDHVYLVSERGTVSVVKVWSEFELVHQQELGEQAFVTPAFDMHTMYLRSSSHLWAFRQ